ncbi:MAG: YdeI/OmpD-associated family protein [Bacteroidia bacterium]
MDSLIKFKTSILPFPYLVGNYLEIPYDIVQQLGGKFSLRLICSINNKISFQCGLLALGNGAASITLNASRMKKLGVKVGGSVEVSLQKDESKYGAEMPNELAEILKLDDEGYRRFENLVPGKSRYIIQHIIKIKNPQLRIEKALRIIENLKKCPEGKEAFKDFLNFD